MFAAWWDARQNPLLFLDRRGRGGHGRRYPDPASMGNLVHPDAIVAGLDHRTTVMLRNIPNKLQPWDLIRLVLWLRCNIDFVYLRIDFSNLCNVGYAFLNFVTPEDIIPFHNALANTKWNVYNSDKVAQICYATIQGRECLIERFRNSGVMTQWVPFRARLFVSSADPEGYMHPNVVGRDAPFPASNNQVKLQRSLDNAFHIGLYPPRPGDKAWRRPNDDNLETRHLDNRDPNVRQQILPTIYENSEALHTIPPAPAMPPMMMAPMGVAVVHPMLMPPPGAPVPQAGTAVPFHPMGNIQQQQSFTRPYIPPHARQH
jgi:RNA recognition motif-containing protein